MFLDAGEHPKPHTKSWQFCPGPSVFDGSPRSIISHHTTPPCSHAAAGSQATPLPVSPGNPAGNIRSPFPRCLLPLLSRHAINYSRVDLSLLCSLVPKGKQTQQLQRARNCESPRKLPMRIPGSLHSPQHLPELTSSCWGEAAGTGISSSRSPGSRRV